jgi:lipoprotein-anchoring transpeptidase ErfK/SrfK
LSCAAIAAAAYAQQPKAVSAPPAKGDAVAATSAKGEKPWVAPGAPGSPIDTDLFHAQVLLDASGFSPGPIDGKEGSSFKEALRGFQEAHGLGISGKLDTATREALLKIGRPPAVMVKLGPDDVKSTYVYPLPKDPEKQYKLAFLGYRNMLEKVAERYHTTPATVVALNGPEKLIGPGQVLRLPNVVPISRDYAGTHPDGARLMTLLNVDGRQPHGDHIVVDKSESALKVLNENDELVAQFPVTTGSGHDPLPIGKWKVTTFAFLPPFHYQPNLFWDAKDNAKEHRLAPGPNGPVGVAWLDLTKEHYGIHGTPEPSTIGKTESHGCIRMTNWDVMRLARIMTKPGFPAVFQS